MGKTDCARLSDPAQMTGLDGSRHFHSIRAASGPLPAALDGSTPPLERMRPMRLTTRPADALRVKAPP